MRTFIALDIEENVRQNISNFMEKVSALQNKGVKFVESNNLHVTIKFIGDIPQENVDSVISTLGEIASEPFEVDIKGIGGFPSNDRQPRVLWVGIEKNEALLRLFDAVDRRLFTAGISRDQKPFYPHLTIARAKTEIKQELMDLIQIYRTKYFGSFQVKEFYLFKSELTGKGPIYSKIKAFPLNLQ
jgi:2'-5' RNA ligase